MSIIREGQVWVFMPMRMIEAGMIVIVTWVDDHRVRTKLAQNNQPSWTGISLLQETFMKHYRLLSDVARDE